ncbi:hypothetical protein GS492_25755 [Rhodococcus hoagii]|nr:hypothetical protein [Prescottella equi]
MRYEYDMECNWKLWAENAVECYHCPHACTTPASADLPHQPDDYASIRTRTRSGTRAPSSGCRRVWTPPIERLPIRVHVSPRRSSPWTTTWASWAASSRVAREVLGLRGHVRQARRRPGGREGMARHVGPHPHRGQRATDIQQIGYNSGRVPAGRLLLDSEQPAAELSCAPR